LPMSSILLPASALQPMSTNGTLAAKSGHVACKKDIPLDAHDLLNLLCKLMG